MSWSNLIPANSDQSNNRENIASMIEALSNVCIENGDDALAKYLASVSQEVRNIKL